jgi:hypothetical protein
MTIPSEIESIPGVLSASYSAVAGRSAGEFSASGTVELSGTGFRLGTWAFLQVPSRDGEPVRILASRELGNNLYDFVTIEIPDSVVAWRAYSVQPKCAAGDPTCASVMMSLGASPAGAHEPPQVRCSGTQGTVTLATIREGRVTGTFTTAGVCSSATSQVEAVSITGLFDVPTVNTGG